MSTLTKLDYCELRDSLQALMNAALRLSTRKTRDTAINQMIACVEHIVDRHIDAAMAPFTATVDLWERNEAYNRQAGVEERPTPVPNVFRTLIDEAKFL